MATLKTVANDNSVMAFIQSLSNDQRRKDCLQLLTLCQGLSGQPPRMWGDKIIGFGSYHYRYASGREGDFLLTGFAPGKQQLTVYIMPGFAAYQDLLLQPGKHKTGKSCLTINKLDDIDLKLLARLVSQSISDMQQKYPCS